MVYEFSNMIEKTLFFHKKKKVVWPKRNNIKSSEYWAGISLIGRAFAQCLQNPMLKSNTMKTAQIQIKDDYQQ